MTARTPLWQRILASGGLLVSAPVLGAAAVVIKMSDPGPILHRATRAGIGGQPFTMYKLRTMRTHTDSQGSITSFGDNRIFPAGRLLRRLKIDEIPQLANVAAGQMALVGPRPEAYDIVQESYLPWMMETLEVPPGVTGPGSLHYIDQEREVPGEPSAALRFYVTSLLPRKLALELVYVRSPSLRYQLELLGRTALRVIIRREADRRGAQWETEAASQILDEVLPGRRV